MDYVWMATRRTYAIYYYTVCKYNVNRRDNILWHTKAIFLVSKLRGRQTLYWSIRIILYVFKDIQYTTKRLGFLCKDQPTWFIIHVREGITMLGLIKLANEVRLV